jgi:hypothetical protein
MIGELPAPGVVIGACDTATFRLTEVLEGLVRIELAYIAPEQFDPRALHEVFDGWWAEVTFDDGTTIRTWDGREDENQDEYEVDSLPDPSVGERKTDFQFSESETWTDGHQLVTTMLFEVRGDSQIAFVSAGWDRVGMMAHAVDVGHPVDFSDRRTTKDARPPGWLTYMAFEVDQDDARDVATYVMEWDWPSRLLRWIEVMPDGVVRAHTPVSPPESVASGGSPTPEQVATASLPIRIPIDAKSFDDLWTLASTTGRVPEGRHPRT